MEATILRHEPIRRDNYIVDVLGCLWELDASGKDTWPILVFPKADYGSMQTFLGSDEGRKTTIDTKLRLCCDIIGAVQKLHACSKACFGDQHSLSQLTASRCRSWRSQARQCPHIPRPCVGVNWESGRLRIFMLRGERQTQGPATEVRALGRTGVASSGLLYQGCQITRCIFSRNDLPLDHDGACFA